MAATSFGDPNLVWQKVFQFTSGQASSGVSGAVSPGTVNALRALKLQLSTHKRPDLQFFTFSEADVDIASSGFTGPTGAYRIYAAYGKKSSTGTTVAFLEFRNQINTTYGTGATGVLLSMRFSGPGDEGLYINNTGLPFTQTTGSAIVSATTINGATSTAADNNSQHGFIVIGPNS